MTPHNRAEKGDFAPTVLMPGDPLRAKFIAENFLSEARLVNDVRGVNGYTGLYKGERVSVMASGMGMPSIGIYSYELYKFYGVENIIRVGSAGALQDYLKLYDIVFALSASTDGNYFSQYGISGSFAPSADFSLLEKAVSAARENGDEFYVGGVLSSDVFYGDVRKGSDWTKMGVLAVEMETAALYMNAARLNKRALSVLTVSDSLVTGEETTSSEREKSFVEMIKIALETALKATEENKRKAGGI